MSSGDKLTENELWRRFGGVQARERTLEEKEKKLKTMEKEVTDKAEKLHDWDGGLRQQKMALEKIEEMMRRPQYSSPTPGVGGHGVWRRLIPDPRGWGAWGVVSAAGDL